MATFTWTSTTAAATAWETTADWFDSSTLGHPTAASFTTIPGNDYVIAVPALLTINNIGAGGTAAPDIANSLTLSDVLGFLLLADTATVHGALDVTTTLSLDSLLNLGTSFGQAVLAMGGTADGGTIDLQTSGRLEGAKGDEIIDIGTSPTKIMGSGTIQAEGGIFTIGPSVQVVAGDTTQFDIGAHATLAFADAVGGGTIVFTANSGSGVLDVAALSTFQAAVKGMSVGTSQNAITSFIDFLNVGTNATATLTGVTSTGATLSVFDNNNGTQEIAILGNYVGKTVNYVSDGLGGTNVFLTNTPCYAAGTAILTPDGEVPVERIRPGDQVMTSVRGTFQPRTVVWVGERTIDLAGHSDPESVAPIRFRPDALGSAQPIRDLLLSPDHCVFVDGALIPARLLINGMTIARDLTPRVVSYHHIELDQHAILLAEGVEAESYLDTGNRALFGNDGLAPLARPLETASCAPLWSRPHEIEPIWRRFAARAHSLGWSQPAPTTTVQDLRLLVDGRELKPLVATGEKISFLLPDKAADVRLLSRSARPGERRPWVDDPRELGVALRSVMLRDRSGETVLGADHPALTDGWHQPEHAPNGAPWRWSAGDARLPIQADGPCLLEITLELAA